jgi:hypothetical protein
MPPYLNPDPETVLNSRFIRIGDELFVGESIQFSHKDIAKIDELEARIEQFKKDDPSQLDAGFVMGIGHKIKVSRDSDGLMLPILRYANEAREITLETFRRQSPGKEIMG